VLQPLGTPQEVLTQESVLHFIGGMISNNVPIHLSIPTRPDYCYALVHLNDGMSEAVNSREREKVEAAILGAIEHGTQVSTDRIEPLRVIDS
jgi:hypothetical protein